MSQDASPGTRRKIRPGILAVVGLVALLMLAAAAYGIYGWTHPAPPTCGLDVLDIDGQCVGVTDGSTPLSRGTDRRLDEALMQIRRQNQDVPTESQKDGRPWVTLAYLLPLPRPDGSSIAKLSQPALVDELRGAAAAQSHANGPNAGNQPRVRLLVANTGQDAAHADAVVPTLIAMADPAGRGPADRLVAVLATGKSYDSTGAAVAALTGKGIPVVTSRLSADDLVPPGAVAPVRTAPTNSDQAKAVVAAFPDLGTAMIVHSNDRKDSYSRSLAAGFDSAWRAAGRTLSPLDQPYEPAAGRREMDKVMRNVCALRPNAVLFAGRTPQLLTFVEAYSRTACEGYPLTVLTGSDAIDFASALRSGANEDVRTRLADGATVYYSALADARAWTTRPDAFDLKGQDPLRGLVNPNAASIMGSDAVTFASDAIGEAATPEQPQPGQEQVLAALKNFSGVNADDLASGWLAVDPTTGLAVNKATPILQVLAAGGDTFSRLSSPQGTPCVPSTPVSCIPGAR